jgi:transposase
MHLTTAGRALSCLARRNGPQVGQPNLDRELIADVVDTLEGLAEQRIGGLDVAGRQRHARDAPGLMGWLDRVDTSGLPEVRSLAAGIRRDRAAVAPALSMAWSNGQTEGQINRLKVLKRQMYGRAKLHLLEKRFLYAARPAAPK